MPDTLIVGAGLAGLACSHHLDRPGEIYERKSHVGGVAHSTHQQGFTFDCTGHWLHLRDENIRSFVQSLIGDELIEVERIAEIHSHGVRTPYPFQANTHGLPTDVTLDCVLGYFNARERAAKGDFDEPKTFEDFIRQRMGDGIADHFMIPYNTKLWTVPPAEMHYAWTHRFVPLPTPEEVLRGAITRAGQRGLGYNSSFLYPRRGGIGRLPEQLARTLAHPLHTNVELVKVEWKNKQVRFADGGTRSYQNLVSTIPLKDLADALIDPPESVSNAASKLRATTVTYWNVGVQRPNEPGDAHWIYFPEEALPFYRAGSASAAVPSLAPQGMRSYYVEVSHPRGQATGVSDQDVLDGMKRVGLLQLDEEPVLFQRETIDCAYVIMDANYGPARETILDWLESKKILSIGRYGAWIYDSMEGAMAQGKAAAERINRSRTS